MYIRNLRMKLKAGLITGIILIGIIIIMVNIKLAGTIAAIIGLCLIFKAIFAMIRDYDQGVE